MQVTEELKLVTKVEWDNLYTKLNISKIQRRKLDIAVTSLNATGPADPTINKPSPLKSESTKKCSDTNNRSEKSSTNNKRKAGNTNIKDYYKVSPKRVIDMTLNDFNLLFL